MLIALAGCATTASAQVITHQADRYVINVEEMDLNGEETILDILMMLPDVITIDGKTAIGNDINNRNQKRLFGQYAVRIDNMNILINPEVYVRNTKAREVKYIKVCTNPGIQKGCGGMKQVIDIYYRKPEQGNKGRVAIEGDSYGQANTHITDWQTGDNYYLHTIVQGALENRKYDDGSKAHAAEEDVKMNLVWDITEKDNLELMGTQYFKRENQQGGIPEFSRFYQFDYAYTRDLGPGGAYFLFQGGVDYNHNTTVGVRELSTNPFAVLELGAPFISKNLYINGGLETGYSATTTGIGETTTARERYEDFYAQLDWNYRKFHFSIGDRLRLTTKWYEGVFTNSNERYNHTSTNNHVTVTSWLDVNEHNTIQGTFTRRFFGPEIPTLAGFIAGKEMKESPVYTTELRYTYQKKDFNIMGIIKNLHTNNANVRYGSDIDHDNILQIGATAYIHKGALRLSAGIDYNWQKSSYSYGNRYNNFINLKLVPQLSLKDGWRFTSTLLYNSRKAYDSEFYAPANFYAEIGASKELSEKLLVEAKFHDIVGQHTGNRAVSVGVTYSW